MQSTIPLHTLACESVSERTLFYVCADGAEQLNQSINEQSALSRDRDWFCGESLSSLLRAAHSFHRCSLLVATLPLDRYLPLGIHPLISDLDQREISLGDLPNHGPLECG